jgi:hypothetical protein
MRPMWARGHQLPIAPRVTWTGLAPAGSHQLAAGARGGRDASYLAPPAQNRTGGFPAYGSHLGCVTAKRSLGQGPIVGQIWKPIDTRLVYTAIRLSSVARPGAHHRRVALGS